MCVCVCVKTKIPATHSTAHIFHHGKRLPSQQRKCGPYFSLSAQIFQILNNIVTRIMEMSRLRSFVWYKAVTLFFVILYMKQLYKRFKNKCHPETIKILPHPHTIWGQRTDGAKSWHCPQGNKTIVIVWAARKVRTDILLADLACFEVVISVWKVYWKLMNRYMHHLLLAKNIHTKWNHWKVNLKGGRISPKYKLCLG